MADIVSAIVVLGCPVRPGGVPSPALERRIRGGVHLYEQGLASVIVMTGGPGRHGIEAHVMRDRAVELGVPRDAIVLEDAARDTRENALFTARLGVRHAIVVSDDFHLPRARMLFEPHFEQVEVFAVRGPGHARGVLRDEITRLATRLFRYGST